jgi:prepilin-type N-terminal cleavage/methylation domain-containing protein
MRMGFRFLCTMEEPSGNGGYTLIEVVIAIVVFAVGALALAASSAFVARAMARNALQETRARAAANRTEIIKSQCVGATILCSNGEQ